VRRRALPAITAAVLLASLVLAGCGSKDGADEPSDSGPDAQNVAAAAQIKATWPLGYRSPVTTRPPRPIR
jgi:predicted small secreted protein